jgi:hypothetical protein
MEVPSDFPAKTVAEFITYAKRNPGKINFASAGQEPFDEHTIDIAREPGEAVPGSIRQDMHWSWRATLRPRPLRRCAAASGLTALSARQLIGENVNLVYFRRFGKQVARVGFFHQSCGHFAI